MQKHACESFAKRRFSPWAFHRTNNPDSIPLLYYSLLCFNNRLISSVRGYLLTTENCFGLGFLAVDATSPLERALNMKCTRLYVLVCTTCFALSKGMKG